VRCERLRIGVRSIYLYFLSWTGLLNFPFIITFRLTGDDQVGIVRPGTRTRRRRSETRR